MVRDQNSHWLRTHYNNDFSCSQEYCVVIRDGRHIGSGDIENLSWSTNRYLISFGFRTDSSALYFPWPSQIDEEEITANTDLIRGLDPEFRTNEANYETPFDPIQNLENVITSISNFDTGSDLRLVSAAEKAMERNIEAQKVPVDIWASNLSKDIVKSDG